MEDIFTKIIMGLLSLDTIRAIIAMTGWVKPEARLGWVIYGRYERNLVTTALKELGFQKQKSEEILKNLSEVAENERDAYGITDDNAAEQLIILIAKYIVYFDHPIQYGGRKTTKSSYYIDTMEMAHNEKDKQIMESIMAHLYASKGNKIKPGIVVTPKGGNPLFGLSVAEYYSANFIIAKSKNDKSRITTVGSDAYMDFQINYEGAWSVSDSLGDQKYIIVDCNISGGSQLIDIANDLRKVTASLSRAKTISPTEVYILFRADGSGENDIDRKFNDNQCRLYRFFDLDEKLKEEIYQLKKSVGSDRSPDLYYKSDKERVEEIIRHMREKGLFYYDFPKEDANMDIAKGELPEAEKTQMNTDM